MKYGSVAFFRRHKPSVSLPPRCPQAGLPAGHPHFACGAAYAAPGFCGPEGPTGGLGGLRPPNPRGWRGRGPPPPRGVGGGEVPPGPCTLSESAPLTRLKCTRGPEGPSGKSEAFLFGLVRGLRPPTPPEGVVEGGGAPSTFFYVGGGSAPTPPFGGD